MAKTLTDHLINVREDLSQLKQVRDYLDSNAESEQKNDYSLTWRTIEAYNRILVIYSSNEKPEIDALQTLLDSFYYIVSNNREKSTWSNFGFQLGEICAKVLSAIERAENFEILFCKFVSVLVTVSDHTSDVWKIVARQILNLFINKKLSFVYFEVALKLYVSTLKKIDDFALKNFAQQNFHLLKTFSELLQRMGDFDTQIEIVQLIFLHVSKDRKLIENFFVESKSDLKILFRRLDFENDFERDCRTYLNALNKTLGSQRNVFSIDCNWIYLGSCRLDPPKERKSIWLDANRTSQRLSTKCSGLYSHEECVIYIRFADLTDVQVKQQAKNKFRIVIRAKNLKKIYQSVKSDEIVCITAPSENSRKNVFEFKNFLLEILEKSNEKNEKFSQTIEEILIDRDNVIENGKSPFEEEKEEEGNVDGIGGKRRFIDKNRVGINRIIPDAINLLNKAEIKATFQQNGQQAEKDSIERKRKAIDLDSRKVCKTQFIKSSRSLNPTISFHSSGEKSEIVPESQELSPKSFVESLNKNLGLESPSVKHSFEKSFESLSFPTSDTDKVSHKLYRSFSFLDEECRSGKPDIFKKAEEVRETRNSKGVKNEKKAIRQSRKKICFELNDSQSENYFRGSSIDEKKKPTLPRLRNRWRKEKKEMGMFAAEKETTKVEKTSLLDPNGYAYRRWMKPTTSKRSNFWLDKLNALEKKKKSSVEVFDFTDESDAEIESKAAKKNKKVKNNPNSNARSGRKEKISKTVGKNLQTKDAKVKVVAESTKNRFTRKHPRETEPEVKSAVSDANGREKNAVESIENEKHEIEGNSKRKFESAAEKFIEINNEEPLPSISGRKEEVDKQEVKSNSSNTSEIDLEPNYGNMILKMNSSFDSISDPDDPDDRKKSEVKKPRPGKIPEEEVEDRIFDKSDQDFQFDFEDGKKTPQNPIDSKSGKNSDEEIRQEKTKSKKRISKNKSEKTPSNSHRHKFWKSLEKEKRETDEIVKIFASATNRSLNRIHRKHAKKFVSYLRQAEEATSGLREIDFEERSKRLTRIYACCTSTFSLSDIFYSMESVISVIRNGVEDFNRNAEKSNWKKMEEFSHRLKDLMEKQIDELIRRETISFRNRIANFAFIFNEGFSRDSNFE